jgi:CheY-like chemotaxis protein
MTVGILASAVGRAALRRRLARVAGVGSALPRPRQRPAAPSALQGLVVLVVEDHEDSRRMLQQMLEHAGARVLLAAHGGEALAQLETQRRPHVILCDLLMPVLDGLGLARQVHGDPRWARIPILAVTALGGAADYIKTWAHGFAGHVTKPIDREVLIAAVRRVAGRPAH